jgi:hypothetical protein
MHESHGAAHGMTRSQAGSGMALSAYTRTASSVGVTLLVTRSAHSIRQSPIMRRDGKEWGAWRESVGRTFRLYPRLHDDGRSESFHESSTNVFTQYRPLGRAACTMSMNRAGLRNVWIAPGQIDVIYG